MLGHWDLHNATTYQDYVDIKGTNDSDTLANMGDNLPMDLPVPKPHSRNPPPPQKGCRKGVLVQKGGCTKGAQWVQKGRTKGARTPLPARGGGVEISGKWTISGKSENLPPKGA